MIRKINYEDLQEYLAMSNDFYHSDAVMKPVPEQYFINSFNEMMRSNEYISCYIIEKECKTAGYALLARTFSPEVGGMVLWLEELYLKPEYRGEKLGSEFLSFLNETLAPGYRRLRLEVEDYNTAAVGLYKKYGFGFLPYSQMYKEL